MALVPAGGDGDGLRVAVGHLERVDDELGRRSADDRDRVVRVVGRSRRGERERDVLGELRGDQLLVIGKLEL